MLCDPSSEPSRRAGSDEGSQHMVSMRYKKNILKYSLLSRALVFQIKHTSQCIDVFSHTMNELHTLFPFSTNLAFLYIQNLLISVYFLTIQVIMI